MANNNQENNEKKKGGAGAVAAVGIIALLLGGGFGFGLGNGSFGIDLGNKKENTSQSQEQESEQEEKTEEGNAAAVYADITVSGNVISYNGSEVTAADAVSQIKTLEGDVTVRIKNDSATVNALDELKAQLDSAGIKYVTE